MKLAQGELVKLIMKTEFDNLRENDNHGYDTDSTLI